MPSRTTALETTAGDPIHLTGSGDRNGFLQRLERAADDVVDQRDALSAAVELRDQLVIEASESHAMTTTAIARAAHLSQSRVVEILAAH